MRTDRRMDGQKGQMISFNPIIQHFMYSVSFHFNISVPVHPFHLQEHFYSIDMTETYLPPRLTLQVWDNDLFNPDDFLGQHSYLREPNPTIMRRVPSCRVPTCRFLRIGFPHAGLPCAGFPYTESYLLLQGYGYSKHSAFKTVIIKQNA